MENGSRAFGLLRLSATATDDGEGLALLAVYDLLGEFLLLGYILEPYYRISDARWLVGR